MDTLEKYYELGSKLGYEGQELRHFVSERDKIDRDERHAVRQSEARKLDAERDEGERKIREVEMTLMHEQEMNRIRLESERMTSQSNNDPISQSNNDPISQSNNDPISQSNNDPISQSNNDPISMQIILCDLHLCSHSRRAQ